MIFQPHDCPYFPVQTPFTMDCLKMPHDFPGTMHRAKKCPCCTSFLRVALLCQILNKTCQNIQTQQELELAQNCTNLYLSLSLSPSPSDQVCLSLQGLQVAEGQTAQIITNRCNTITGKTVFNQCGNKNMG